MFSFSTFWNTTAKAMPHVDSHDVIPDDDGWVPEESTNETWTHVSSAFSQDLEDDWILTSHARDQVARNLPWQSARESLCYDLRGLEQPLDDVLLCPQDLDPADFEDATPSCAEPAHIPLPLPLLGWSDFTLPAPSPRTSARRSRFTSSSQAALGRSSSQQQSVRRGSTRSEPGTRIHHLPNLNTITRRPVPRPPCESCRKEGRFKDFKTRNELNRHLKVHHSRKENCRCVDPDGLGRLAKCPKCVADTVYARYDNAVAHLNRTLAGGPRNLGWYMSRGWIKDVTPSDRGRSDDFGMTIEDNGTVKADLAGLNRSTADALPQRFPWCSRPEPVEFNDDAVSTLWLPPPGIPLAPVTRGQSVFFRNEDYANSIPGAAFEYDVAVGQMDNPPSNFDIVEYDLVSQSDEGVLVYDPFGPYALYNFADDSTFEHYYLPAQYE